MPRNYSNTSVQTTLFGDIAAIAGTLVVLDDTGYPAVPFAIVVDAGSVTTEEVMLVTGVAGTTWTVTRGYDGTTAIAHSSGAIILHAAIAADFTDATAHAALTTTAHGGIVPSSRQLTINGTAQDLSADRSWTVGDLLSSGSYNDPAWLTGLAWAKLAGVPASFTPSAHAASHAAAGADPVTPSAIGAEPALGNPAVDGYVPSSTMAGVRSWIAGGGVTNVTASSPLASSGGATPNISVTGQLAPANGGTGTNNTGNLAWPSGGGTAALLATANVFTAAQTITLSDAATNKTTLATLGHNTSGTAAVGFGSRVAFTLQSTTTADRTAAALDVSWETAADATRRSQIGMFGIPAGSSTLTEYARFGAAGNFLWSRSASVDALLITVADANGGSGLVVDSSSTAGVGAEFKIVADNPAFRAINSKNSTGITNIVQMDRRPNNSTASGNVGTRMIFTASSSTSLQQRQAAIDVAWGDYTHATRYAYFSLSAADYGSTTREFLRGSANGTAATIGFLGAAAQVRQASGADLTNSVTSGGTDDTIADYTIVDYATDAATIRNDIYQLARKLKQVNDALRLYGLLT